MRNILEQAIIRFSPFAQSHNFSRLPPLPLEKLAAWETAVPGEDRSVATARLREAYEKQLTTLDLSSFSLLTTLPEELPTSLTSLDLSGCSSLTTLPPHWPVGLTELTLRGCSSLTILPQHWPAGLTELDLSDCTALTTLPQNWPAGLAVLSLFHCTSLTTLPQNWPASLTILSLSDCISLTMLPPHWSAGLTWLTLNRCTGLTALVQHWPAGLTELDLSHCTALTTLPQNWPAGLAKLNLRGCSALTILPQYWPASLTELYLSGCSSLTGVPHALPAGLHIIALPTLTVVPAHERWFQQAQKTPEQIAALNVAWPTLTQEMGFNTFNSLLERLGNPQLKAIIIPDQVVDVIDEAILSPEARLVIFNACQEADQDCHDRVLVIFNTIQAFAKVSSLQRQGATLQDILRLSLGIARQTFLDESVPKVMQQQWQQGRRAGNDALDETGKIANQGRGTGPNTAEALEVQLALRHQLTTELVLPFAINGTLYTAMAGLNDADRILATQYVNVRQSDQDRVAQALLMQPVWIHYLMTQLAAEVEAIKGPYAQALEQFEQANAKGVVKPEIYLPQLNQLVADRDYEIQALLTQRTLGMLQMI